MRQSLAVARVPEAAAPMIPLTAAGREPLFFYGTLTDRDVLAHVLDRPVTEGSVLPAELPGFRRICVSGVSYPQLVPAPDRVQGLLLRHVTRRDIVRINHFESGEYRAELHAVRLRDGSSRQAWLYMGLESLAAERVPWDLAVWQRQHKPGFFAACDAWMADCPEPD